MTTQPYDLRIEESIRGFIAQDLLYCDTTFTCADDASFLQEGIIDSLGVIELVEFVRKTFGVTVDQKEVTRANFDSVAKLAAFVRRKTMDPPYSKDSGTGLRP